jgi:hypothetical protein
LTREEDTLDCLRLKGWCVLAFRFKCEMGVVETVVGIQNKIIERWESLITTRDLEQIKAE